MANKRVQQFFQLTERSIQGGDQKMPKQVAKRLLVLGILMLASVIYLWQSERVAIAFPWFNLNPILAHKSDVSVVPPEDVMSVQHSSNVAERVEPYLKSQIPVFHLAAARQILQAVHLQRAELLIESNEEDASYASMVVMDKVIVMPKMMLSNAKQVA